jgi:predicted amidohydrolase YtcJ
MQIVISTQQAMGWSIGKTFKEFWGRERGAVFAPNKTWLENLGHPYLKAGSDNRPIDPFIGFWAYLAREDVTGDIGRPDQILGRQDVLRAYTANGAYGIFEEDDRGSIEKGKLADLLVLSDDILTVPKDRVRSIRPMITIVGGEIKYHYDVDR